MSDNKSNSKKDEIKAIYNAPVDWAQLFAVRTDQDRRLIRQTRPTAVVESPPLDPGGREYILKPIKGTVILIWARPGSGLIPKLAAAYADGDEAALESLSAGFADQLDNQTIRSVEEGLERLFECTSYFDVVYGSTELIGCLGLPRGIDFGAVGFPYNGGSLDDTSFKVVEHYLGEPESYETLIVKVPPRLTELELQAVQAVPAELSEINIGHATVCPLACGGIIAIGIALYTCAGVHHEQLLDGFDAVVLPADQLERLGPLASARQLLAVRRNILQTYGM